MCWLLLHPRSMGTLLLKTAGGASLHCWYQQVVTSCSCLLCACSALPSTGHQSCSVCPGASRRR